MILTKSQAIEYHREFWNLIADETEKAKVGLTKEDIIENEFLRNKYGVVALAEKARNHCFLCEYAAQTGDYFHRCASCPLNNYSANNYSVNNLNLCLNGLYIKWRKYINQKPKQYKRIARLAREIASLPVIN